MAIGSITDVFSPDALQTIALTNAIEALPFTPSVLDNLNVFTPMGIRERQVAIEEWDGQVSLLPTVRPGQGAVNVENEKRVVTNLRVPLFKEEAHIISDEVVGVRAFGETGPYEGPNQVLARKLAHLKRILKWQNTKLKLDSIQGKATYETNSVNADLDIFKEFGLSAGGYPVGQVKNFQFSVSTNPIVEESITSVTDAMIDGLGQTEFTGAVAICGPTWYDTFIKFLKNNQFNIYHEITALQPQNIQSPAVRSITVNMVTFVRYYGSTAGSSVVDTNCAYAFPVGPNIMMSYYAPSDFIEAAGTLGIEEYARSYQSLDGSRLTLQGQSAPLHICTRPKALIKLTKS
jgi:hypothetical protein